MTIHQPEAYTLRPTTNVLGEEELATWRAQLIAAARLAPARLEIDLRSVQRIEDGPFGALVLVARMLRPGGEMVLVGPPQDVRRRIAHHGLSNLITVVQRGGDGDDWANGNHIHMPA